jgi:hypothetical protein
MWLMWETTYVASGSNWYLCVDSGTYACEGSNHIHSNYIEGWNSSQSIGGSAFTPNSNSSGQNGDYYYGLLPGSCFGGSSCGSSNYVWTWDYNYPQDWDWYTDISYCSAYELCWGAADQSGQRLTLTYNTAFYTANSGNESFEFLPIGWAIYTVSGIAYCVQPSSILISY